MPKNRSKTNRVIEYPLVDFAIDILQKLKWRAGDSDYVFPNRRASKRHKHVSPDTLNSAINKLFKQNKLKIEHFTVHDLRRSFGTQLADLKVSPYVAEKCLNHKLPKIMEIYDRGDYFEERKEAHAKLVERLKELV